jgi:hypothetical protein
VSKLHQLRQAVQAAATAKPVEADQLFTFLREGRITDTGAGLLYEATAVVVITEWAHSAHPITWALVKWLRTHENAERNALAFEVDVITHKMVDLNFELPFTETVVFDGTEFEACSGAVPNPDQFLPP